YKTLLGDGDAISSLTTADLNQDGFHEIIVGNNAVHTGSVGVFFRVLDGRSGELIKQSPSLSFNWQGLTDLTPIELNGTWFVYGLINGSLYQYNFSNNSVKQLSNTNSYQQLTSVVIEGATELAVTDQQGKIFRLAANGNVIANATVCNSAVTGLSSAGPDRVLFTCNNSLNEYNLTTQSSVYSHATGFTTLGDPKLVRHNNQDQIIVGGQKVAVYQTEAAVALPAPEPVRLSSHVLKALSGTLKISAEIDYFALSSGTKLGQFAFTDRKTGQFTYQPTGRTGTETLKFYAVKGKAISVDAELTIELTNNKPVVENLNISTHWDKAVQLTLPAKDDDQETLLFALASEPKHGQLKLLDQAKGTVEYIPSGDSLDAISFGFTAKDSLVSSDQKNVVVTLTNTTPVANAISYTTSYQTPVNGAVKGQDADNDVLSYEITSQPATGNLTLDSHNGLFVYTPSGESDQQISFSYVVKDKFASSTAQTVSITVKGAPQKSSGGAISMFSIIALLVLTIRRRRQLLH
ncbi:MAG: cadherin-like domain-containing protein, partial [Gammaproteobacteria bacterium]|nr:cadherin-like domain-containing protein [Gammaproteobacteria bacterium]